MMNLSINRTPMIIFLNNQIIFLKIGKKILEQQKGEFDK